MWLTTHNKLSYSRAVIDALPDEWDAVAIKTSVEALCVDSIIVPLRWWGKDDFGVSVLPEIGIITVVVAPIALEMTLRLGVMNDISAATVVDVAPNICVEMSATMTVFESIPTLTSSEEALLFGCTCWSIIILDCPALQTSMPSFHVWSKFVLPVPPQFLNQEPPRAQQLALPDFWMMPHFGHKVMTGVVAAVCIIMGGMVKRTNRTRWHQSHYLVWVRIYLQWR